MSAESADCREPTAQCSGGREESHGEKGRAEEYGDGEWHGSGKSTGNLSTLHSELVLIVEPHC